ncbi:MAG: hypothetical protein PHI31_03485 [Desulfuromonadaceae bacterium]|nr:hypothetical protein [Desulfuromonadaceae bacterium]
MNINHSFLNKHGFIIIITAVVALSSGGCSNDGPAIEAHPQVITFAAPPVPNSGDHTATVVATASSNLAVIYGSSTPAICSVDSRTGVVTGTMSGTCTVTANQSGNTHYAPAAQATQDITFNLSQAITFAEPPTLSQFDTATVSATTTSALPVSYSSTTPSVCSVNSGSGLVTALLTGDCIIVADAGSLHATQTIPVAAPTGITLPGIPAQVTATAGTATNTVEVRIGATSSGGSPITGYSVTSSPSGVTASGTGSSIIVSCPTTCAGYSFSVAATNTAGTGPASAPVEVITAYNVIETFYEPDTQPNNSLFIGSFTLNSTTGTVTGLHGILSESMTGSSAVYPNDTMTWLSLNNQLSTAPVTLGGVSGLLVTTFLLPTTNTFTTAYGGDGWAPGTGYAMYYGFPTALNPKAGGVGNAYAMIFVNTANPTAALTQAQIDKLAYADCAAGGMMSSVCMTGTTVAGYGTIGSMSGHPVSQTITKGITP